MDSSFGTRLREQRERRGMTLAAVSAETKIAVALLEGLERDNVSRWPGGIFRRAYVRAYARAVGLEPEAVVREFAARHPDPMEMAEAAALAAADAQASSTPLGLIRAGLAGLRSGRESPAESSSPAESPPAPSPSPAPAPDPGPDPAFDLQAMARLCTALGSAGDESEVRAALADAARLLGARGVTVWLWDGDRGGLHPVIAHGYPDAVLRRMPPVGRGTDNAVAEAFRAGEARVVSGGPGTTGAFVAPLLAPGGCKGVLALEFEDGGEQRARVRALATILGAQLSTLCPETPIARAASA